ncbi:complement C1s subcomponent [Cololabis saira]|uniref:complement C1s subcomponent n=1 Tax=Cololabis saira TaxID=129043 RepID=UPI002AD536DE|nr:complement C1s subcomponent [Cololabis saira]
MVRLSLLLLLVLWLSCSASSTLLGWVESPGYPRGYPSHASLNWSRCAPAGHTLSMRLIHLDLEDSQNCKNDAVKVFSNGNLIYVLCGKREAEELESTVNPMLISFPGGCLKLLFNSDYSNIKRHTGFRGFYSIQDFDECMGDPDNRCTQFCHNFIGGYRCSCHHGYHLAKDKHTCSVSCNKDLMGLNRGDISSPAWPRSYAENANCRYSLSVEEHLQLELHFNEVFDVEQSPDGQCIDALTIETQSGILGPFCGQTPPPSPLPTHSNNIKIVFTSDSFGTNKGFSLNFKTRDKVCRASVTSNSRVTPEKKEYNRGETVIVTCDAGYLVNITKPNTEDLPLQYETTCQSSGTWSPSHTCELVDCGLPEINDDSILQLKMSANQKTQYKDQIQFHCPSDYYVLEGDDTYNCSASGEWVSSKDKSEMPKCTEVCGMLENYTPSAGRILGGKNAKLGETPWQLLIKDPKRGGASLINDRWAVTAAHVVDGLEEITLNLYGGLVDGMKSSDPGVSVLNSEKIIIHPDYERGIPLAKQRTNYDNDIALIKMTSRVKFGPNLQPICLPEGDRGVIENLQGTVSGWGWIERKGKPKMDSSQKGHMARLLKYAHISVYSQAECMDTPITSTGIAMSFTDNMFCAGAPGKDSCAGDSGGPLVVPGLSTSAGPYYLNGIVSWGAPCMDQQNNNKGYYTKVENYVRWIKEKIQMEEQLEKKIRA